jgi:hypothetical protein
MSAEDFERAWAARKLDPEDPSVARIAILLSFGRGELR